MNAKEFLESKGISGLTIVKSEAGKEILLSMLMNEFKEIASGQKFDLDKKFENVILPTREEIIREWWRL